MEKQKGKILLFLVMLSLLAIGAVMLTGFLKKNPSTNQKNLSNVLGENTSELTPTPIFNNINNILQSNAQNAKDALSQTVTQKVTEIQKSITNTIEQEVTRLTQSQMDALKTQICRDWGVISPIPTQSQ
ncbi:hypothetical protein M1271_02145 [Patescibacteria group bacterium]|nr:hypothetical protein [Patescibacteria group bacterium]MCL5798334.1 hypothetical protein [Patescibacteria group bacterium]